MVAISVKHNFPEVQQALQSLQQDVAKQALVRAVNRSIEQAKTGMSREIRGEFNISRADVEATLRVRRANYQGGLFAVEASLESRTKRGRSLNLIRFGARQTRKGVTFKVKRRGPRQLIPGAFIANEGRTVFIRVGRSRLPIKALQTIDVPQMFNTQRINDRVVSTLREKFPAIFAREAAFYLARFNARKAST